MSNPSRRKFLQAAAATAVGAATLPAVSEAAQPRQPADPFGGFTVGIQSYSYRQFTFERALEQMQMLGVRNAELYRGHLPTTATEEQIRAARKLLEKYQVTPVAFGVENFTKDHDANRRLFEFGRRLGMTTIFIEGDPERRKPGAEKAANLAGMRFATLAQAVEALLAAR